MTVVCFKIGDTYTYEHVNKLYNMIDRNTTHKFNLVCFTEDTRGIKTYIDASPLPEKGLGHWWHRMELFKKGILSGRCVNIDLDVVIHDNIDELFELDDELYMVPNGIFGNDSYNDCVVKFNPDKHHFMWDKFSKHKQLLLPLHGVDFAMTSILQLCEYKHKLFTKEWFWRFGIKEQRNKKNKFCHFMKLNDTPKQHEVRDDEFVKEYWR